ncbi:MAG: hypothetical protein L6R37_004090 [Teloschistes peruensis]|nr:MAG: hypothetical protein L6R37_004090 [Teloschistes peruensis]
MDNQHWSVLDLPQLYTKPSAAELLSTLDRLEVKAASFDNNDGNNGPVEDGLPNYLTSIVASKLAWIDEVTKEQIWEAASLRLSERSGRSALQISKDDLNFESPLQPNRVIELGAGTGLMGLAIAAMFPVHVHLTDLPEIVPNLRSNVVTSQAESKTSLKGNTTVGELDWSQHAHGSEYDLVVVADPIYSPQHPAWLVNTIDSVLKRDEKARVLIELPLREAYNAEVEELKSRMVDLGLVIIAEGFESGFEDWENARDPSERTKVQCWWAVWGWSTIR